VALETVHNPQLQDKRLFYINAGQLNAKSIWANPASILQRILNEIEGHEDKIVLFIDEIHALFDKSDKSIVECLKEVLDCKKLCVIFATTPEKLHQIEEIDSDSAFLSRCYKKELAPLSEGQILSLLRQLQQKLAPQIKITDEALQLLIQKTQRPLLAQPRQAALALRRILEHIQKEMLEPPALQELVEQKRALQTEVDNSLQWGDEEMRQRQIEQLQALAALEDELKHEHQKLEEQNQQVAALRQQEEELLQWKYILKRAAEVGSSELAAFAFQVGLPQLEKKLQEQRHALRELPLVLDIDAMKRHLERFLQPVEEAKEPENLPPQEVD
jgi:ATP-dependent Clp protease ATP-binding subunit ClpA